MKGSSKIKVKRAVVKALPFSKPVAAKNSSKAEPSKTPVKTKRNQKLMKVAEPADRHREEHQGSNYLAYERAPGAGVKRSSK